MRGIHTTGNNGRRALIAALALLGGGLLLARPAAAQVSAFAYADKTEMGDAETLAYTLELTGDLDGLQPVAPPDARGLALATGTPVLQSRVVANGREKLTLRWLYEPQGTGTATILPARIEAGGHTLHTAPIEVTVVPQAQRGAPRASRRAPAPSPPGAQAPSAASGGLFLRTEPRTRRVVVGEQVVVDYVLYFAPELRPHGSPQLTAPLNTDGFWRETLEVPARALIPRDVTVGGEAFRAATVFRLALFPTRSGTLDLGPTEFEIDLVRSARDANPFAPLFSPFISRFSEERVRAPAVTITVDPLPGGAPASFHGAVGRFGLAAFTDRDRLAAGEPVQLTVEIRGTGNIATLAPPEVPEVSGLDVFGPEEDRLIDRREAPLSGAKTFTYTLVPRGGGDLEIPPLEWSYYDPESGSYETLRSAAFPLEVSGAPLAAAPAPADPSVPLGLMAEVDWRRADGRARLPLGVLLAGLALPLLALLGLVAARRRMDRRADRSPEARALRAHPEAARRLRAARAATDDPARFYAEVEQAVRRFLAERFALPSPHVARADLGDVLARHGVAAETRAALDALLADCERGQFAPRREAEAAALDADAGRAEQLLGTVDGEAVER